MTRSAKTQPPSTPLPYNTTIRIKEPMQGVSLRRRYEYDTITSDRPLTLGEDMTAYGAEGWRFVGVFVRFDTVHVILEREVTG